MTRAGARVQRGAHLVSSLFQFLTLWLHLWGATRGRWLREIDAGPGLLGTPLPRYEDSQKSLPRGRWLQDMDGPSDTKSLPEMGAPCQLHRLT